MSEKTEIKAKPEDGRKVSFCSHVMMSQLFLMNRLLSKALFNVKCYWHGYWYNIMSAVTNSVAVTHPQPLFIKRQTEQMFSYSGAK